MLGWSRLLGWSREGNVVVSLSRLSRLEVRVVPIKRNQNAILRKSDHNQVQTGLNLTIINMKSNANRRQIYENLTIIQRKLTLSNMQFYESLTIIQRKQSAIS